MGNSATPSTVTWTAIVLTGGGSRRMGRDKATLTWHGRRLLDHVLDAVTSTIPAPTEVIVVGPRATVPDALGVHWRREDPPGGGPVAAIGAALPAISGDWAAVIATDMPLIAETLEALVRAAEAAEDVEALLPVDNGDRPQPLCALYRTSALRRAADAVVAERGSLSGASMRSLTAHLTVSPLDVERPELVLDLDRPEDLTAASAVLAGARADVAPRRTDIIEGTDDERTIVDTTDEWLAEVSAALGLDGTVDTEAVLDVTRDVAHGIARPAAPLTAYLLGVAVGRGASAEEAAGIIRDLLGDRSG